MRFLLTPLLVLSLVLPALAIQAQAPENDAQPSVVFRTTVSEVTLDVVVRDKSGKVIRNLRPGEVRVFENGVEQSVRHFEFVDGRLTVIPPAVAQTEAAPANTTAPAPASTTAPTVNELRDLSLVSVVIADLDPRGRKLAMSAMEDFIKAEMQPNTYVGVFGLWFGKLQPFQMYTNNAEKISAAMEQAASTAMLGTMSGTNQLAMPDTEFGSPSAPGTDSTASAPSGASFGPGTDPDTGPGTTPATAAANGPAAAIAQLDSTSWVNEMHDVYVDSTHYLTPLRALVQAQAEIPGRKVVLLFSAGLPVHPDTSELLQSVISAANKSNVSIYAVDPRGFTEQSTLDNSRRVLTAATTASRRQMLSKINGGDQTVTADEVLANEMAEASIHADTRANLAELAEGTGGSLLPETLDLREPLQRAMEDVRMHYELNYSPSDTATDGTFRKIEVKVSRPGVHVFARSGYYALPMLNGRQVYPFEMATLKALNTRPMLQQFSFHAAALQYRPGTDRTQMDFVFQSPTRGLTIAKEGQWARVHVCVTALIKDDQGKVVEKISKDIPYRLPIEKMAEMQQGVVSFTAPFLLPPGHYTLETAAVDREAMKASVKRSALIVDGSAGLSVSDIALARRVDPIDGPVDRGDPLEAGSEKVTPEMSDVIHAGADGDLKIYAIAYPPRPIDAPVDVSIEIWRNGQMVVRSPESQIPPDASGAASILAGIPASKLPLGRYEAHVRFLFKDQSVVKILPFALAAGS